MVLFTANKKGFGIYGLNLPWMFYPGALAGLIISDYATRQAMARSPVMVTNTVGKVRGGLNFGAMVAGGIIAYTITKK
jgi:hypothetical protein